MKHLIYLFLSLLILGSCRQKVADQRPEADLGRLLKQEAESFFIHDSACDTID